MALTVMNVNKENEDNNLEMYSGKYINDGVEYVINDTFNVHQRLSDDPQYLKQYLETHLHSLEISNVSIPTIDAVNEDNTESVLENFSWTSQTTKLLLSSYQEKKAAFRDPKIKKKKLWSDIREKFVQKGYKNITEDCLDRKMRNMKKTFHTIKDNNKKTSTGRGRISWEYFDLFQDIFEDDRTINIGTTLSSLRESQENEKELQPECHVEEQTNSLSYNSEQHKQQFFSYIPYPNNSRSPSPSSLSTISSCTYSHFSPIFLDDSILVLQEENSIDNACTSNNSQNSSRTSTPNIQNKSIRPKGLYMLKKEQLQLDAKPTFTRFSGKHKYGEQNSTKEK